MSDGGGRSVYAVEVAESGEAVRKRLASLGAGGSQNWSAKSSDSRPVLRRSDMAASVAGLAGAVSVPCVRSSTWVESRKWLVGWSSVASRRTASARASYSKTMEAMRWARSHQEAVR
jgi:hypothetical protein